MPVGQKEKQDGEQLLEADTVILAGMAKVDDLVGARKKNVYVIGDARTVRRGNSSINDGFRLGMRL